MMLLRNLMAMMAILLALLQASTLTEPPEPQCNLPLPPRWPPPDGCLEYAPIAPPSTPIPSPCIVAVRLEQWDDGDVPVTSVNIFIEHPELGGPGIPVVRTTLARYGDGGWGLADMDWDLDCGKDEGPLTWASLQILNGNASAGLAIYRPPLPGWYTAFLLQQSGRYHFLYLPAILVGEIPPP